MIVELEVGHTCLELSKDMGEVEVGILSVT